MSNLNLFEEIAAVTATYRAVMGIESVATQETSRGSNPEVRNAGIGIDPAPATDLYDIRLTRTGLDGEALEPRIGRAVMGMDNGAKLPFLCNEGKPVGNVTGITGSGGTASQPSQPSPTLIESVAAQDMNPSDRPRTDEPPLDSSIAKVSMTGGNTLTGGAVKPEDRPAFATDLYDIRFTRTGLDGEELEPRIGRLLTSDPEQAARDMCKAIASRGNPARIETVEIVRSYGAEVFVVRESL